MKRWSCKTNERVEDPKADAFIEEILAVCRRHGLMLGHEDTHGAFVIEPVTDAGAEWIAAAHIGENVGPKS